MVEAPLSESLEYAILAIVCRNPSDARHQDHWGGWRGAVQRSVPDFADAALLAAFKRLWKRGVLRLSKSDPKRYHAHEFSGNEFDDDSFFFTGPFNATITDEGRSHWNPPRPVCPPQFLATAAVQLGSIALNPSPDRDVVDAEVALRHNLFQGMCSNYAFSA